MSAIANPDELRAEWEAEYARPFSGWDFSSFGGRRITIRPAETWDYTATVLAGIDLAQSMLDMDTGGGEALAGLPRRPPRTVATEGYAPNVPIARQRLEPLGIEVVEVRDPAHLPFADGAFDLVTNRHGGYEPRELRRVLADGGRFITQQVGSRTNRRLHELLGHPPPPDTWNLAVAVERLAPAGFQVIEQREEMLTTRYLDTGALVYYLKAVPWEIPDFSVDRYFDRLLKIHALILAEGHVDIPFHQFFITAQATATHSQASTARSLASAPARPDLHAEHTVLFRTDDLTRRRALAPGVDTTGIDANVYLTGSIISTSRPQNGRRRRTAVAWPPLPCRATGEPDP